jgi:hypothetical protein
VLLIALGLTNAALVTDETGSVTLRWTDRVARVSQGCGHGFS